MSFFICHFRIIRKHTGCFFYSHGNMSAQQAIGKKEKKRKNTVIFYIRTIIINMITTYQFREVKEPAT